MPWLGMALLAPGLSACSDVDDRPATWSYISAAIIQPNCATARCHNHSSATLGLQLDTVEGGYLELVGAHDADGVPLGRNLVVPGDPDSSKLMWMLRGVEAQRMPPDEPLPDADVALIEKWIRDGAVDR
jgi:hypothetical protein